MKTMKIVATVILIFGLFSNLLNIFVEPAKTIVSSIFGIFLILLINNKIQPPIKKAKKELIKT